MPGLDLPPMSDPEAGEPIKPKRGSSWALGSPRPAPPTVTRCGGCECGFPRLDGTGCLSALSWQRRAARTPVCFLGPGSAEGIGASSANPQPGR